MSQPVDARSIRIRDWSYGLALFGAHLMFMPLLVLLLPRRVEVFAGDNAAEALSQILLVGAVVASIANIAAGALNDRWMRRRGNRRVPLIIGLAVTTVSYAGLAAADDLPALTAAFVLFQLGLNATLSPFFALLTDYFPNSEKGRIAGLANAALPLSAGAVAPLAWLVPADGAVGFLAVWAIATACCVPLVVLWPFAPVAAKVSKAATTVNPGAPTSAYRDFALAWIARFLVQFGAVFVIGYLYVFVAARFGAAGSGLAIATVERVGVLALAATVLATVSALASGRLSDRQGMRRVPLAIAALVAAFALAVLGNLPAWLSFVAGYALFHAALAGFLAVDTALVAEMLAANPRRAALLGVMNLTNTLPAVLAPGIALLVFQRNPPASAIAEALTFCATGCGLAALAVLGIRSVR